MSNKYKIFVVSLIILLSNSKIAYSQDNNQTIRFVVNKSLMVSPSISKINKNKMLFGGFLNFIEIWDSKKLKLLKREILDTEFSNFVISNNYLITGNSNNTNRSLAKIDIFDINNWKKYKSIKYNRGIYYPFVANDEKIIAKTNTEVMKTFDRRTGKLEKTLITNNKEHLSYTKTHKDKIYSYSTEEIYGVWDIKTGYLNYLIKDFSGIMEKLFLIKNILIGYTKDNKIIKLDIEKNKIVGELKLHQNINDLAATENSFFVASKNTISEFSLIDNKKIKDLKINNFNFSKILVENNKLVSLDEKKDKENIIVFDLDTNTNKIFTLIEKHSRHKAPRLEALVNNKIIFPKKYTDMDILDLNNNTYSKLGIDERSYEINTQIQDNKVYSLYLKVNPNYSTVIQANILDLNTKNLIKRFKGTDTVHIYEHDLSKNIYHIEKSKLEIFRLEDNFNLIKSIELNIDKSLEKPLIKEINDEIVSISDKNKLYFINLLSGEIIRKLILEDNIESVISDNKKVVTKLKNGTINIIDLKNFEIYFKIDTVALIEDIWINNNQIILLNSNGNLKTWSLEDFKVINNKLLEKFEPNISGKYNLDILNNRLIFKSEQSYKIWDINTVKLIQEKSVNKIKQDNFIKVDFINDYEIITKNNNVTIKNIVTNKNIYINTENYLSNVYGILNNNLVLYDGYDRYYSSLNFYSLETGKIIARLYSFPDSSIIITPEGYYAGTGNYQNFAHFLKNDKLIEIDEFKEKFNKPEIVKDALSGISLESYEKIDNLNFSTLKY